MNVALLIRFTKRAAAQIELADHWWAENRPSAPQAFREDLEAAFAILVYQPNIGARVSNTRLAGVRRLHLTRIRYHLFYRVKEDALVVLALWHTSRGKRPEL